MLENLYSMNGKICVVTGGSSGLGSYMARGFLEAGAARVYISARSEDKLKAKAVELSALADGECIAIPGDLSAIEGIQVLANTLKENENHIDVLVNNAGVGTGGPFADMKPEVWDMTMGLNLRSPVFVTQALLDLLKANATHEDPARVIFTSSVAASENNVRVMAYATSKNTVEKMTPLLALAMCDDHILVNTIAPEAFYSEMTRDIWEDPDSDRFKALLERIPVHRFGGLEDMAGVAVMLCSRAGSYFTGEVLNLDGGHRLTFS
ncbi:MAG TPA: 3-oxoacyl-ACP reductase [Gammaproteobacteria bacterium]|nr:3-oxoacyl-ACP reductase [Gammaproteobacteria bacterium]